MARTNVRSGQIKDYDVLIEDLRDFAPQDGGGLTLTVSAGRVRNDNTITDKASQNVSLTDDATNYVEIDSSGVASANTSAFTSGSIPIAQVVTASGDITSVTDKRSWISVGGTGSGGSTLYTLKFQADEVQALESNFGVLEQIDGTTVKTLVRAFDRATREYVNGSFIVPDDLDTSGSGEFKVDWTPRVAPVSSLDVIWAFEHAAIGSAEDFDGTYTEELFSASASGTTQDNRIAASVTETVSNLGWAAGDLVFFRFSRKSTDVNDTLDDAATSTDDDALAFLFTIEIPVG